MTQSGTGAYFEPIRNPIFAMYQAAGAELETVDQFVVPLRFTDAVVEERAAREGAALAPRNYLGRLAAVGKDVLDLLDRLSSNQVGDLAEGQGRPTALLTDKGRILDLLYLFHLKARYLILTTRGMSQAVREWLDRYTIAEDVATEDITGQTLLLTLLGPRAAVVLQQSLGIGDLPLYGAAETLMDGAEVIVARTDPFGLPGYDILVEVRGAQASGAEGAWRRLTDAGAQPVGEATLEALRVEAGWPARNTELTEERNPLEAGLRGAVSFRKCYIGQEVVARLDTYKKLQRRLVRLALDASVERGTALESEGKRVGEVTSVVRVPSSGAIVGLGYVRIEAATDSTHLTTPDGVAVHVVGVPMALGPGEE